MLFVLNECNEFFPHLCACAGWFSWGEIHETERVALREFFDLSSISRTPKIYKEYRDFIINKYREDPSRRLTFTDVRKSLVGDISLLHKVFLFLENWGLINFGATDTGAAVGDNELKHKVGYEEGVPNGIRVVAVPNSGRPLSAPTSSRDSDSPAREGSGIPPLASFSDVFRDIMKHEVPACRNCSGTCSSGCYENRKVLLMRIASHSAVHFTYFAACLVHMFYELFSFKVF